MGAQLDRMMEDEERRRRKRQVVVDRTSSMSAGQVEQFWKKATLQLVGRLLEAMPPFAFATPSKDDISEQIESEIDDIAAKALEEVIGR